MKDRKLHFYVNGKDVGIAATNIPDTVYGLVDLFYGISPPVKLIPDVREVRSSICTRTYFMGLGFWTAYNIPKLCPFK